MKTRNFLLGAMGLFAMASCSNDEVISVNHDGDEITFSVVTNASSRVASDGVYCNNNLPSTFYVWAKTTDGNNTYIEGDEISRSGEKWVNESGTRYWPAEGTLNFYAYVNAVVSNNTNEPYRFIWNNSSSPTIVVTVPTEVSDQKDLLYAVKTGQTKTANSGQDNEGKDKHVNLNFRHALSQIVFTAQNTNSNLYVEISDVSICNVNSTSTFTYPTADTDNNIVNHGSTTDIPNHGSTTGTITPDGSWGTFSEPETYSVNVTTDNGTPIPVLGNNVLVSLTNTNEADKEFSKKAMLLLPQTSTKWDVTTDPKSEANTGTYFLVKCCIYNVAGETVDKTKDVCLWGTEDGETKEVAIPVELAWTQGQKYIYTFVFGEGNGGYDPNPDPETNPEPVLVPIKFDVTVDDFVPDNAIDVPEAES